MQLRSTQSGKDILGAAKNMLFLLTAAQLSAELPMALPAALEPVSIRHQFLIGTSMAVLTDVATVFLMIVNAVDTVEDLPFVILEEIHPMINSHSFLLQIAFCCVCRHDLQLEP